jgi:putative membrane protein
MNSCHAIAGTSIALGLLFLLNCSPKDESATRSSSKDQTFFNTAAQGNLTEVAAGGLAVAKSANFDVKAFGQRIIKDHSKASGELSNLAVQKNFSLPSELDAAHQMGIDRLTTLSGAAFDQAFAEMMVTDHVKASSLIE